eukprot:5973256-Amphidinium_carterae.1
MISVTTACATSHSKYTRNAALTEPSPSFTRADARKFASRYFWRNTVPTIILKLNLNEIVQ